MRLEDWFLTPGERGNDATEIDRRRGDGRAWTTGNDVRVLVHGREYFTRLYAQLCTLQRDEWIHFTDWRGDPDERLNGPGTEIARVLAELRASRRARARPRLAIASRPGTLQRAGEPAPGRDGERSRWRSIARRARRSGGQPPPEVVRGAPPGSSRRRRRVRRRHRPVSRSQRHRTPRWRSADDRDRRSLRTRPAWHDAQLEVRGPAVGDLAYTFRERWEDPTPVDHRNPVRARLGARGRRTEAARSDAADAARPLHAGTTPCRSCGRTRPVGRLIPSHRTASAASRARISRCSGGPSG